MCSLWGSNPRPLAHKTSALITELRELLHHTIYYVCLILWHTALGIPRCVPRFTPRPPSVVSWCARARALCHGLMAKPADDKHARCANDCIAGDAVVSLPEQWLFGLMA